MPTKVDRVGMIHHKNGVTEPTFEDCPLCVLCRREACAFREAAPAICAHRSFASPGRGGRLDTDSVPIAGESLARTPQFSDLDGCIGGVCSPPVHAIEPVRRGIAGRQSIDQLRTAALAARLA